MRKRKAFLLWGTGRAGKTVSLVTCPHLASTEGEPKDLIIIFLSENLKGKSIESNGQ